MQAIAVLIIAIAVNGMTVETYGPHQEAAKAETVAVLGKDGNVLYYNKK